jgi:hypothetical protein
MCCDFGTRRPLPYEVIGRQHLVYELKPSRPSIVDLSARRGLYVLTGYDFSTRTPFPYEITGRQSLFSLQATTYSCSRPSTADQSARRGLLTKKAYKLQTRILNATDLHTLNLIIL